MRGDRKECQHDQRVLPGVELARNPAIFGLLITPLVGAIMARSRNRRSRRPAVGAVSSIRTTTHVRRPSPQQLKAWLQKLIDRVKRRQAWIQANEHLDMAILWPVMELLAKDLHTLDDIKPRLGFKLATQGPVARTVHRQGRTAGMSERGESPLPISEPH